MEVISRSICSIEDSINLNEEYQSVVDRYYSRKYCVNVCGPGDDYSVLIHSNGVCLLNLAPSHSIMKSGQDVVSVNFQVTKELNRLNNKVTGKLKHGAQKVKPASPILIAKLKDGTTTTIHCSIAGKLLEVNERLIDEPNLMVTSPDDVGYVAIILPDLGVTQTYRNSLLSKQDYENKMKSQSSVQNLTNLVNSS